MRARAQATAEAGHIATVFRFSPTAIYHHVQFDPAGYWVQSGGLFGRSDRSAPLLRFSRFSARVAREIARTAKIRGN